MEPIVLIVVGVIFFFVLVSTLIARYKRCPSDKILVIYGKTGGASARCIHGGGAFIWPVIQDYEYLDLKPISIEANLTNALSKQNIRVDVPCRFTIAISSDGDNMNTAAERLLGLDPDQIQELAKDILFGQLRLVIATMTIEEINSDRDKFLLNISQNVDSELKKIGLKLINVNVTDIKDESGYIEALGKEAAAKAINEAKISVAEQEKIGETGKAAADQQRDIEIESTNRERDVRIAETHRDRDVNIAMTQKDREVSIASAKKDEAIGRAEAESLTRIKTSTANAQAIEGENQAKIAIANSEALRREKEAESNRVAISAEKVQQAKALEESYTAEQKAEAARSERERATQVANIVIPAEIAKEKSIIEAQAEAERLREAAKGEADAIFAKMEAEAKGLYEILTKQAEGYKQVVDAAGGDSNSAFQLLLLEKLPELVKTQVDAVKGIKIDKVTVWDSGAGNGDSSSTANFVSGMMKSVPPLNELFNMAGLELPKYLAGKEVPTEIEEAKEVKESKSPEAEV
ncbi:flotillin family protein [Persicobacter diffluens]|uniref:Flotillin n=1 Tax=Persicobacter diffluens TaxID=981 RepID=A0AAN4VZD1_9BACT|nr:flotillin [Persicobacter diffluens]